jgi:hypothetical protein
LLRNRNSGRIKRGRCAVGITGLWIILAATVAAALPVALVVGVWVERAHAPVGDAAAGDRYLIGLRIAPFSGPLLTRRCCS